jgi:hypothetical protein
VAPLDVLDPGRRLALDRVGAGLALRLAARHVAHDLLGGQRPQAHLRDLHRAGRLERRVRRLEQGDGRQHLVGAAGQCLQHAGGVLVVGRLSEDALAERHGGVGAQHRGRRQAARQQAFARRGQLEQGHPPHVVGRRLARERHLERLAVLAGIGQQQLVAHADLGQQLAAAGTLGGEVEKIRHGHLDVEARGRRTVRPARDRYRAAWADTAGGPRR